MAKFRQSPAFCVLTSTLTLLGCGLGVSGVRAQPASEQAQAAQAQQAEQSARWSWRELQREMGPVELSDPARAIAAYQKFYESRGSLYTDLAVAVTSRIAQVYGRQLQDPAKAGEILAWALEQWGHTPYRERLQREAAALAKLGTGQAQPVPGANAPGASPGVEPVKVDGVMASLGAVPPVGVAGVAGVVGGVRPLDVPSAGAGKSWVSPLKANTGFGALGEGEVMRSQVAGQSMALRVALEEMHAGRLSAQAAWERGALRVDDALRLLEQAGAWGNVDERPRDRDRDVELRRSLAGLVVQHAPELLGEPQKLALPARLWIADALGDARDPRGVALFESVLAQVKQGGAVTSERQAATVFLASERLAWLYRDTNQHEKEAQTWLGLPPLLEGTTLPERTRWMLPDALLGAARAYSALGQQEKARALYAQVPKYGHGWFSVLSLYDQAQPLLGAGKIKEAYDLMNQPLQFTDARTLGVVAQQSWLASFAYRQGDLEAALKHGRAALEAGGDGSKLSNESVKSLHALARDIYNRAGGWKTQPIQSDVKELIIKTNPSQPDKPLYARFRIKTYGDTTITATVDNPAIQVRVLPVNNWQREGLNAHEEEMEVIVQSNSLKTFKDVSLVLSSATRGKTTTVRLSLVEKSVYLPSQPAFDDAKVR